ncbi:MAG TPA: cysteine desulfurase family protein [Gammaproteobacteria bacterium]|nr:cysteine desulfurase family protein [Gammaproteobacteria bacterium]
MTKASIYLDYAATTPVDPRVVEAMLGCLGPDAVYANAASTHPPGSAARALVERARAQIAARVGAQPDEIVFTSGATESSNLALKGALLGHGTQPGDANRPTRVITTRIEHKSVLDTADFLAAHGVEVTWVQTDATGRLDPAELEAALAAADDTALVSVMHVNNELGTIQDIAALARTCARHGAWLHVDAAQSAGKLPLELGRLGVHLCSLTAHKIYGPKGVGALYVRAGTRLAAQIHGGAHEGGLRSGTLATHQIVGMGASYAIADPEAEQPRIAALAQRLWRGLQPIPGVRRNTAPPHAIANILSVCFPGVEGESLRFALSDIALSSGSACNSAVPEPSYVLRSLGLSDALAGSTLRISLGRFTTPEEVDYAVKRIGAAVGRLRGLAPGAPAWCST